MPISIPTNIAGISVPTDAVNGPLAALYGNKYQIQGLKYPRDLGSNPARNHVIKFSVWKRRPTNITQIESAVNSVSNVFGQQGENITQAAASGNEPLERLTKGLAAAGEAVPVITGSIAGLAKTLVVGSGIQDLQKEIFLYVPDTLNVNYSAAYDDISITESLGKALFIAQAGVSMSDLFASSMKGESLRNIGNKVLSDPTFRYFGLNYIGNKLGMQNIGQLGLQGINQAINPQLQVLFRGIGFRTFQFDFLLTPYNQKEAQDIKNIVQAFKYHSAPKIVTNLGQPPATAAGAGEIVDSSPLGSPFFEIPETFRIHFFYKGEENPNVNRIAECVLTSVNVDYAPSGWATHNEGAPVQTRLTLQFQEIEIIDKAKIQAGY